MEQVLLEENPDALIVYGDTNTTLGGAQAAAKLCIPVVHVEAGIRQQPATIPEKINRQLTDRLSHAACCCLQLAKGNLVRESNPAVAEVTGDVMYDLFIRMSPRMQPEALCRQHGVTLNNFVVATVHRDFNTDTPAPLQGNMAGLARLGKETGLPVLLPLHPRTRNSLTRFGLAPLPEPIKVLPPLGYLDLMSLAKASACVLTDSGGLQKEANYAHIRAVVLMADTGWRELTEQG